MQIAIFVKKQNNKKQFIVCHAVLLERVTTPLLLLLCMQAKNKVWYYMQIVSLGDNLHEVSNLIFWVKQK